MNSQAGKFAASKRPGHFIANVVRGSLIGLAELVPGVSGGTLALITGIYERALDTGNSLIDVAKAALSNRSQLRRALRDTDWFFLLAVAIGMLGAVFALSGAIHTFVEDYPGHSRSLFFGMVAVSVLVPLRMIDLEDLWAKIVPGALLFLTAAAFTFWGVGFSSVEKNNPALPVFFFAAAIAVCALVLPGVSGSFFLLAVGLYGPTMQAVSEREVSVLGVFALGALTGIVLFVRVLGWLLHHHRSLTLITMAGVLCGSLRALWPGGTGISAGAAVPLVVLGVIIVVALLVAEKKIKHS